MAARRMMGGGQDEGLAMLVAWGMSAEAALRSLAASEDGIYADNWPALSLMLAMATQWRIGYVGRTGLDYAALPAVMDLVEIERDERPDCFSALRVMENEILLIESDQRGRQ